MNFTDGLIVGILIGLLIVAIIWRRKWALGLRHQAEVDASKASFVEHQEHQLRDHQLNHGRRVFNVLKKELQQYADVDVRIYKIENNGGGFSIVIDRKNDHSMQGSSPILQLDYDFEKYAAPYQGHIHYGPYGADILVWVGDHAPMHGLDRLVLAEVQRVAEGQRDLGRATA